MGTVSLFCVFFDPSFGTFTIVPSSSFSSACCTPSPPTSRPNPPGPRPGDRRAILSISSRYTMPRCAASTL
eukprot:scaffold8102_cov277-Pinguiococcus_pyrenoidosus.AAC.3